MLGSGSAALRSPVTAFNRPAPSRSRDTNERRAEVIPLPTRTVAAPAVRQPSDRNGGCVIELNLLGGFRLLVGGELVAVGRTGQRLLAAIACRGRQVSRSQLAHTLWPDTTSARAHANLRTALYRLFRSCPEVVYATNTYVQLAVGVHIDLEQAARLANNVLGNAVMVDEDLVAEALQTNLYDDLLPDWDDDWIGDHQYRHRQLRLTALETLSGYLTAAGHHGAAVQAALAAVQADSLRDSAHESLIRACLAQGNRHEAYLHYTTYRRILRDELGLDPPATVGRLLAKA